MISAGWAMYGTWNSANAEAARVNATTTHAPAAAGPSGSPANMSMKHRGSRMDPRVIHGMRGPHVDRVRSDQRPTMGLKTTSHVLGRATMRPAAPAATPYSSVRYGSSTSPGSVENPPVPTDPAA